MFQDMMGMFETFKNLTMMAREESKKEWGKIIEEIRTETNENIDFTIKISEWSALIKKEVITNIRFTNFKSCSLRMSVIIDFKIRKARHSEVW